MGAPLHFAFTGWAKVAAERTVNAIATIDMTENRLQGFTGLFSLSPEQPFLVRSWLRLNLFPHLFFGY
jgi:hypothetical protein